MWEYLVKSKQGVRPRESADIHPVHRSDPPASEHRVELHNQESASQGPSAVVQTKQKRVLDCPVCRIPMKTERLGGVEIDKCPKCAGVFLDRGELAVLSQSSFEPASRSSTKEETFLIYTPHGLSSSIKAY